MPRSNPADKKTARLNAPATLDEVKRFKKACKAVGVDQADVVRQLATAFAEHVERHGKVTVPIEFK